MDILTFLGLHYRDASLIALYFIILGISVPNQINRMILSHKNLLLKSKKIKMDILVTIKELRFLNRT